jgi:hypothetical protein
MQGEITPERQLWSRQSTIRMILAEDRRLQAAREWGEE